MPVEAVSPLVGCSELFVVTRNGLGSTWLSRLNTIVRRSRLINRTSALWICRMFGSARPSVASELLRR
jgi:hypothetical protein